jgi:mRNA-degrading endonuclease YafQ of YafQ-DinJ toxin-antitoxin module
MALKIKKCRLFYKSIAPRPEIAKIIIDFSNFKIVHPIDKFPKCKKDKPLVGIYKQLKLCEVYLEYDLRLIYAIRNGTLYLYGIFTHAELGTDNKPRQQRNMMKKFKNQFDESAKHELVSDEDLIANGFSREDGEAIIRAAYDSSQWSEAMTMAQYKEYSRKPRDSRNID